MAGPAYNPDVYGEPVYSDALIDPEVYGEEPLAEPEITGLSFKIDAVLKRTQSPTGFTLNAQIVGGFSGGFTVDAVKLKHRRTGSPFALVQSKSATGTSPTGLAFNATPTAGNLIVLGWVDRNGTNNDSHVAAGFTQAETHVPGFASARLYYKKANGTESGELYTDVGFKTVVWIAEFSGVDADTAPQHQSFLHNGSGDRVNATHTFTVTDAALLVGMHYGDSLSFAPLADSTELFDRNINGVEPPQVAASYRAAPAAGTFTEGETHQAGADNLASLGLAFLQNAGDIGPPFTVDAQVFSTRSFTLNAQIRKVVTGTFTLDAVKKAARTGSFIVNALIKKTQTGSFTLNAEKTSSKQGNFTLNAVIKKTASGSFTVNAYVAPPLVKIFGDNFNRTTTPAQHLGPPWSWHEIDSISGDVNQLKAYTDGSTVVMPTQVGGWYDSYVGFPFPQTGEAYFDFKVPATWSPSSPIYGLNFDRLAWTGIYVEAWTGGQFALYQFGADTPYVFTPTVSTMYRVHALWTGSTVQARVWKVADPEPGTWQYTNARLFAAWPSSEVPPFLDLYYFPTSEAGILDNLEIWTSDASWKGFGGFQLQARIITGPGGSFTLNAQIAPRHFTVDAWLRKTSFTLNAVVKVPVQGAFLVAAHISRSTFTVDAYLVRGGQFNINAVLKKATSSSFTINAEKFAGTRLRSFKVDANLRRGGAGSWYVNAELRLPHVERVKAFPADAVIRGSNAGSFDISAWIIDRHKAGSFTVDADTRGQNEKRKTFTVNAVVRLGGAGAFVVSALIGGRGYFRLDAYIRPYFRIDAEIVDANHQFRAFTVNATLFKGLHTGAFGVGAEIWKSGTQAGRYFWLDAWIKKSSGTKTFTVNAQVRGGGRFTIDAFVRPSFTVNAYIRSNDVVIWPDEQSGGDGSTPTTGTFTSPTAEFTPGMVGSTIIINGVPYTIVTVVNPTTVTVSPSIPGGQSGLPWSIEPGATDPDGNPLPPGFKSSRKYRLRILIDGVDVTGDVNWARTSFTQNAKTNPGTFEVVLYGPQPYIGGEEILVELDDFRTFGGYVLSIDRGYVFDADAEWPVTSLRGADFNVLFDKLITYNTSSADDGKGSYKPYKSFAVGSLDTRIINKVFGSYVDLPPGFDYKLFVDTVGVAAPEKPWAMPTSGSPLRQVMQSLSQVTEAVWWIDPYKRLHYGSRTKVTAPFPITDGVGGISSRQLSFSEDISQLVTDGFCWGTLAYTVEGEIRVERRKSSFYGALGPFQYGEFRSDLHHTKYIERRIESVIDRYGEPVKRANVVIFEPGYQAGQVADVRLTEHGLEAPLVIRSMVLTFAVSKGPEGGDYFCVPRFELAIGLDPEEPWDIYDYLPFPPYHYDDPGGWVRATDLEQKCIEDNGGGGGGCSDEICGPTDAFSRTVVDGWGVSDAGLEWTIVENHAATSADVSGGRGHMLLPAYTQFNDRFVHADLDGLTDDVTTFLVDFELAQWSAVDPFESLNFGGQASGNFRWGFALNNPAVDPVLAITSLSPFVTANTSFPVSAGAVYHVRGEIVPGSLFRLKVWSGAEPDAWTLSISTTSTHGGTGSPFELRAGQGSTSTAPSSPPALEIYWSNLAIASISGDINRCTAVQFDDFNRTVASGWGMSDIGIPWHTNAGPGPTVSVDGSVAKFTLSGVNTTQYIGQSIEPWIYPVPVPWTNGVFTMTSRFMVSVIHTTSTGYSTLMFGWGRLVPGGVDITHAYMQIGSPGYYGLMQEPEFDLPSVDFSYSSYVANQWYLVKVEMDPGVSIKLKFWLEGTTEPDWMATMPDTWPAGQGGPLLPNDTIFFVDLWGAGTGTLSIDSIDFDYDGKPCYCDDSEAQTWADQGWEWEGGSGAGAFAGAGWSIAGNDATLIEPAGGDDRVNFIITDTAAPGLFAALQAGPFLISGVMTLPYDLAVGSGQPLASNAFQILFRYGASGTTVASLEAILGGALGGRILLYAPGITNQDTLYPNIITAGSWPWTMAVTSTSVTASIAGHTLSVAGSFNLADIDALRISMGDGSNPPANSGTWRMSNITFQLSDGSTWGVACAGGGGCGDVVDDFDRTVAGGWGTSSSGHAWVSDVPPDGAYSVDGSNATLVFDQATNEDIRLVGFVPSLPLDMTILGTKISSTNTTPMPLTPANRMAYEFTDFANGLEVDITQRGLIAASVGSFSGSYDFATNIADTDGVNLRIVSSDGMSDVTVYAWLVGTPEPSSPQIIGSGAAGTRPLTTLKVFTGVGGFSTQNITLKIGQIGGCEAGSGGGGGDPSAPGGPCADEEGETFGSVTRGWGCETILVDLDTIMLTGQAARGTLTLYDADTGDHIAEGWFMDQAGKTFRVPAGHERIIACYRNYTPEIGSEPSVPRIADPSVRRRYS